MERRSARRGTPRKRYTVDAFEGIPELQSTLSEDEEPSISVEDADVERDFHGDPDDPADEDQLVEVDVDDDDDDDHDDDAFEESSDAGERLLEEALSIAGNSDSTPKKRRKKATFDFAFTPTKSKAKKADPNSPQTYTRGLLDVEHTKNARRTALFGPSPNDFRPIHAARIHWAYDPTLPSRSANDHGLGDMHRSFFVDEAFWKQQLADAQQWWFEQGGQESAHKKQVTHAVEASRLAEFMPESQLKARQVLLGPHGRQQVYSLPFHSIVALTDAWEPKARPLVDASSALPNYKKGFVLNLSARINCLDWAPGQDGQDQYLAVSVLPERESSHAPFEAPQAPAFSPPAPHKSNVQIWKFARSQDGSIDMEVMPERILVLCIEWGDVKELKWCPTLYAASEQSPEKYLGLLAGVCSDGYIRVLNLSLTADPSKKRTISLERAMFESRPPDTICTTLTWIGTSRLAAGCANGCVAIWDLPACVKPESINPRPTIYSSVSTSYIFSIISCYPSRPNLLLSASVTGYITMSDLSQPGRALCSPKSAVFSGRNRVGQPLLQWHDFTQMGIHVDEMFSIRGLPIRRLFSTVKLGKCKSNATALATSPCHPSILVGTASGEVFATNPIRKAVVAKSAAWQQTWFAHEWRWPTAQEATDSKPSHTASALDPATQSNKSPSIAADTGGLSRISEGFKAERLNLADTSKKPEGHDNTLVSTVYELQSSITALAWNPNLHVGGWAAAGMGDGLLRVEDIAV